MNNAKCPMCNNLKIKTHTLVFDLKSGKPINVVTRLIFGGALTLFGGYASLAGFTLLSVEPVLVLVFLFIGSLFAVPGIRMLVGYFRGTRVEYLTCTSCGHKWYQIKDHKSAIKCPVCEKPEVVSTVNIIDGKTRSVISLYYRLGLFIGIPAGIILLFGGVWSAFNLGITGLQYTCFSFVLAMFGFGIAISYFQIIKVKVFGYKCLACGHNWKQWEDRSGEDNVKTN